MSDRDPVDRRVKTVLVAALTGAAEPWLVRYVPLPALARKLRSELSGDGC